MPCYLFTYHGYGTWLPDREHFVERNKGILPQDLELASKYRERMIEDELRFDDRTQQLIVDEAQIAAEKQNFRLHYVATESTHVHVLVSWNDERPWKRLRTGIKTSFSKRLKQEVGERTWFSDGSSRRRIEQQEHFDYLVATYLPKHGGRKWKEGEATVTARAVGPRLYSTSALLITAAVSRYEEALHWTQTCCVDAWGPIAIASDVFDFTETDYYNATMGTDLKKVFFAFENLIDPAKLPDLKRQTNLWEEEYAAAGEHDVPRPLNLDPGYITLAKLVLASTKDHAHRIYLRDGIYAEVTLHFQNKTWQSSPWSYPDYQRTDFQAFFTQCREYVKMWRRKP